MTVLHHDAIAPTPASGATRAAWLAIAVFVSFPVASFLLSLAIPANLATFAGMATLTAFAVLLRPAPPLHGVPLPLIFGVVLASYLASLLYHGNSPATLSTSLSVIGMAISVLLVARRLIPPGTDPAPEFLHNLRSALLIFLVAGFATSAAVATAAAGIASPLVSLLSSAEGGRLRLLARVTDGHSLLIPAAFLVIIAELRLPRGWVSAASIIACTCLLVASGTRVAAAYLGVAVVFAIVRALRLPKLVLRAVLLTLLVGAALVVWAGQVNALRPLLDPIQAAVPGLRIVNPASTLGSGRDGLNDTLWRVAADAPVFGVGYDNPAIAPDALGPAVATNESFLRVVATRGWLVALPLILLFTAPLVVPRRRDPALIAIAAGSSLDIVLNGNVERLSSPSSVWLWLLAAIIICMPPRGAGASGHG